MTSSAKYLLLAGALVPPSAFDVLGNYLDEKVVQTPYGQVGPLALRGSADRTDDNACCWIQPYTGLPTRTDPRATLYAARMLGLSSILSWDMGTAVNAALGLGQTVLACDYIDRTRHQPPTFHAYEENDALPSELTSQVQRSVQRPIALYDEAVAQFLHQQVASGQPSQLSRSMGSAVYLGLDGPRRETPAEARIYRQWGADVLGHNLIPEVFLAHEIGLTYTGLVTVRSHSADIEAKLLEPSSPTDVPLGIEQTLRLLAALVSAGV